jgi:hypothetical protein
MGSELRKLSRGLRKCTADYTRRFPIDTHAILGQWFSPSLATRSWAEAEGRAVDQEQLFDLKVSLARKGKTLIDLTKVKTVAALSEEMRQQLAAHTWGYLAYTILAACAKHDVPVHDLPVTKWKKTFAKRGNATKIEIQAAVQTMYPDLEIITDDHSDAIGIGHAFIDGLKT